MSGVGRSAALVASLVLMLLMVGCEDSREGKTVTEPFAMPPMPTICVGRHLIDLPVELQLRGDVDLYYGLGNDFKRVKVQVLRAAVEPGALEVLAAAQIAELVRRYDSDTPSKNYLSEQRRIDETTVLIRAHAEPTMMGYYKAIVVARVGEAIGMFSANVYKNDKPEDIEAKVLAVVQKTSYMADPTEQKKGTCIGPLVIDAGQDGERFDFGTRGTKHIDLSFELSINSLLAETDGGLLARVDSKANILKKLGSNPTVLRRGKVTIAGRPGEELSNEEKGPEEKIRRRFAAETLLTKASTFAEPRIAVGMFMGGQIDTGKNESPYVDPSINKKDSLALWDSIIKSIRPRAGAI